MSDRSTDPDVGQTSLFTLAATGRQGLRRSCSPPTREAKTPQTELRLLQAMTFFDDRPHVDRTLDAIIDGSIRNQDGSGSPPVAGRPQQRSHLRGAAAEDWSTSPA
jgi:hypothetical protein